MTDSLPPFTENVDSMDIPVKRDVFAGARDKLVEKYGPDALREMGKRGGATNAATHDHAHFVAIGKKGGAKIRELLGRDHYSAAGKAGAAAMRAKYDAAWFSERSRKAWVTRKANQL